jgi:hydroxymethylglutaryl-CoA synthase
MRETRVGISDMSIYIPQWKIDLEDILQRRAAEDPSFERRLRRAIESTNQMAIRFSAPWQDSVTLAAQAARPLLEDPDVAAGVRYLAVGTETSVDLSKPIAAYAQGALQRSGVALPRTLSTFQVQHACAGGTIAMMSVAGMLKCTGRPGESGLVINSDVARYQTPSTAEITQGAGAVALRIETDPRLLELDTQTVGFASSDEDDFFRPLGSVTARVKGRYSVDCYNDALSAALVDHADRRGVTPREAIESHDYFVVHVPFHKMAVTGLTKLVERHLEVDPAGAHEFLEAHHFDDGIEASRWVGNIYSGSAYMSLMFLLWNRYRAEGESIVGKRILLASYGSGNTMTVLSSTIAAGAPEVLSRWDLRGVLEAGTSAGFERYEGFIRNETYSLDYGPVSDGSDVDPGLFYLEGIRDDGYRQYAYRQG